MFLPELDFLTDGVQKVFVRPLHSTSIETSTPLRDFKIISVHQALHFLTLSKEPKNGVSRTNYTLALLSVYPPDFREPPKVTSELMK